MKAILALIFWSVLVPAFGQSLLPVFLKGTWKVNNAEIYEHWDQLNDKTLKGFSYRIKNGQINVTEYLNLTQSKDRIVYTATVVNQNLGKPVSFTMKEKEGAFIFENLKHDFPKQINYRKLSDIEIEVRISDLKQKEYAFNMRKLSSNTQQDTATSNSNYDALLAEKLGGDAYGMKKYILVILKTGANTTTDKTFINESFRGHLQNINRLVEQGKLIVAGPLGKNTNNYRGIFILNNINTLDEAKEILQTDPAVKAGLLDIELFNWYGSAALPEYLPASDKIWKQKP
ncbi:hypothetical protein HMPREF0765_1156 [Sphingobacterium spiritivorum ATCC 33300]|uniref:YCII-related domain-containing protein n=1 Tax=Sphingobacterium spiritivorum ATCC 33300 TaxID=525372 RepID=C2FV00_SPHSI|nr:DUF6265 family protein [Sphingobacterium spiritivorum]EEI93244.1 hypothetical protein HMPREF0765_1156 [Sphingobacterium spiritivorum ATCC 33300]QQS96041.1 hypothetical protein I6J03_22175 [Sphingobacterium spiritivorum]